MSAVDATNHEARGKSPLKKQVESYTFSWVLHTCHADGGTEIAEDRAGKRWGSSRNFVLQVSRFQVTGWAVTKKAQFTSNHDPIRKERQDLEICPSAHLEKLASETPHNKDGDWYHDTTYNPETAASIFSSFSAPIDQLFGAGSPCNRLRAFDLRPQSGVPVRRRAFASVSLAAPRINSHSTRRLVLRRKTHLVLFPAV
jgi:hypothetical protein